MGILIALLGLGALTAAGFLIADGSDSSDDASNAGAPVEEFSDVDDTIIDAALSDDVEIAFDTLVAEGELTQEEADEAFEQIVFRDSQLNVSTLAGDDGVLGGSGNDTVDAGSGQDSVFGGPGDDRIELGDGDDVSGIDTRTGTFPDDMQPFPESDAFGLDEEYLEGGDDYVRGGDGADNIADGFGANDLIGKAGNDFLIAVDQDGFSPDNISGGTGNDAIVVDEGDFVKTGSGRDFVTVDLFTGVGEDFQPVVIEDFTFPQDTILVSGDFEFGLDATRDENPIAVETTEDGLAVTFNGIVIIELPGADGVRIAREM